ncbi:hypothetical protein TOPH_03696 [Tolypocladium ophioglossoides CBS 100239]|uniref:DUF7600 domain-containing protein n=1 Tax=Tolypocladium ophioglossoides (strain CBS 100239) TaxID=1163406 RepID=A0A0L0NCL2_TOLOC|nr:hypothetical protein TOPH_03696 [Tolypocladium ophioglossoides CBS 100239]
MAFTIVSCVICGNDVRDDGRGPSRWLEQFRLSEFGMDLEDLGQSYPVDGNKNPTGIAVSGVGVYSNPRANRWIVPFAFDRRWDDMDPPLSDQVGVMHQGAIDERYGYPVHEACWALADEVFSPHPVPHTTLFEICECLPAPLAYTGLSWGHDYGGLLTINDVDFYPWEDRVEKRVPTDAQVLVAREDPRHVDELKLLIREQPQAPPIRLSSTAQTVTGDEDCFGALPVEIRLLIACSLSTADAANLRLASRAFTFVFQDGQFWASRFTTSGDRSWIFEAPEWVRDAEASNRQLDWRWLYHRTNATNCSQGVRNRQRVWTLLQDMREALSLQWMGSPVPFKAWLVSSQLKWAEVTANIHPGDLRNESFNEGCRISSKLKVSIPRATLRLEVFLVRLGRDEHVAGLRFISNQEETLSLGYRGERKQVVWLHGALSGFELAMGSRGVQGIQCVFDDGGRSPWVGCRDNLPRTRRLVSPGCIVAVEAGFDVGHASTPKSVPPNRRIC